MFKLAFKNFFIIWLVIIVLILPILAIAQTPNPSPTGVPNPTPAGGGYKSGPIVIVNPFKANTIQELIKTIIDDILIPIGAVVAVVMIMYAGFLFVTARGDSGQITKAKDALLYAVIGAAILLGASIISKAIEITIGQLKI